LLRNGWRKNEGDEQEEAEDGADHWKGDAVML
jgi:hypothetical protein